MSPITRKGSQHFARTGGWKMCVVPLCPIGTSNRHHKIVLEKPLTVLNIETQEETQP